MRTGLFTLALAIVPAALLAQASSIDPICKAERVGDRLNTIVQYPDGYVVEAPWRIVDQRGNVSSESRNISVRAVLDSVIEFNPVLSQRIATPFPSSVDIVFEADSEQGILEAAAHVWCATVARVRGSIPGQMSRPVPFRVSTLPARRLVG
ncbi:MAG TPA: hypothetical protein VK864_10415 [Longimicrobiales bacterium]|nr:hypothetical protein [Longimicrobiales bacterium]